MKKILLLLTFATLTAGSQAQTKQPVPQNKVFNLDHKKDSTHKTSAKLTSNFAIYHGVKYPVYVSKNGKLFIKVTSKKGNVYNKYIQ